MLSQQDTVAIAAFLSIALIATTLELAFPARAIPYRRVLLADLGALALYMVYFRAAVSLTDRLTVPNYVPTIIFQFPLWLKLAMFYVVEDFGLYWAHRLMHTKHVWRIHNWHHARNELYWLSAVRATIPHIILFNLAFISALPFLYFSPPSIFLVIMVEHMVRNAWMHMNVAWGSTRLEWIFVTPRYHHIHHSADPAHNVRNLGSLLTVWDRMFGTYLDPAKVSRPLLFGTGVKDPPLRVVLGI